jgi:hypothetical protein
MTLRVSNTICNGIEQVIEDEKWDDSGYQTGGDRGRSMAAHKEQIEGNRADAHDRYDFGRDPYYFCHLHDEGHEVIPTHRQRRIWCVMLRRNKITRHRTTSGHTSR